MQVRHRIPTIFSLYMVDVLCCALGCVVLLWQLYHYESQEEAAKVRAARLSINSLSSEVDGLKIGPTPPTRIRFRSPWNSTIPALNAIRQRSSLSSDSRSTTSC